MSGSTSRRSTQTWSAGDGHASRAHDTSALICNRPHYAARARSLSKQLDEWTTRVTALVKDLAAKQPSHYDPPARAPGGRRGAARRRRRMARGRRLAKKREKEEKPTHTTAQLIEAFGVNVRAACLNASWNVVAPHGLFLPGKVWLPCPPLVLTCTDGPSIWLPWSPRAMAACSGVASL